MSGRLTTHVLDIAKGVPAAGMKVELHAIERSGRRLVIGTVTNEDGRIDGPLLEGETMVAGLYELTFHVGAYFHESGGFLDTVPVRFRVVEATGHYHVPLLCSPWAYSTYRGS